MGKTTGFLDYDRKTNPAVAPLQRLQDFHEFHPPLQVEERQEQAARCMNCGIPFCQSAVAFGKGPAVSGCPLHNLIPEWNDELYNGHYESAKARLLKTASFPEFTGRVCPALCEVACTCGLNGDPVTVRENELFLIEQAYATGNMKPHAPAVRTDKTVAVIGSGPSGLATADALNKRGHNVTVFEREDRIGGLLMYGIPNMKLEKQIIERRRALMEAEGVVFRTGCNVGADVSAEELLAEYDAVVLCCGAKQARTLNVGEEQVGNVFPAVDFLTRQTRNLLSGNSMTEAKGKKVIIVGGGDTGNDCVGTCLREGCASVTQIEMMPKPPAERPASNPWPEWPVQLKTDYGQEEAIAVFGKDPRVYQTTIKEVIPNKKGHIKAVKTVKLEFERDPETGRLMPREVEGSEETLACDLLLIAAGFTGCEAYTPGAFHVECGPRNTVQTSAGSYATGVEKVFTAGDMHRGQSLVVWAIAEGRACAVEVDRYLMGYTNLPLV